MIKSKEGLESKVMAPGITAYFHTDRPKKSLVEVVFDIDTIEPMHYHEMASQTFYVISGIALFTVNGEEFRLSKGQSISIDARIHHMAKNVGEDKLEILVFSQPSATGDRVVI